MPRAALLSIHARVKGTKPTTWEDPSLVQVWGPRYSAYVVAARDVAIFTLGRLPDDPKGRGATEELAARLHAHLAGRKMTYGEAGRGLGVIPNSLRYAARTATVLIRWDGARLPTVWTVSRPEIDPRDARLELARRYLHVFGPATHAAFAKWAGISTQEGSSAFDALRGSLIGRSNTSRRRVDPRARRTDVPRRSDAPRASAAPAERRHLLPAPRTRSRASGP
jgi:hypothetical protein